MSEIIAWSVNAADNSMAVPNGWPEGMNYSAVNDVGREMMAGVARHLADHNGTLATGGSGNAYSVTTNRTIASYTQGLTLLVKFTRLNTGAPTLNVNNLGAQPITDRRGDGLRWADILAEGVYLLVYNDGAFNALGIDTSVEFTGKIVQFSGAVGAIPPGWRLCNGANGTPNLMDRFLVGAGSAYGVGATGGATTATTSAAGSHSHGTDLQGAHSHHVSVHNHTLSEAQMPSHAHLLDRPMSSLSGRNGVDLATGGFVDDLNPSNFFGGSTYAGGSQPHNHGANADWQGAHTHTTFVTGSHQHQVTMVPPYYALAFLMRTSA